MLRLFTVSKTARRVAAATAGLLIAVAAATYAQAESASCAKLRKDIEDATRNSDVGQFAAAADKQRGEIDRTTAYARSIGCENHKFLIFGSDPPPQCGALTAQLSRMRANLEDLQARSGGGAGGRGELMARYRSECLNTAGNTDGPRPPNFIEGIFGQAVNGDGNAPLNPDAPPDEKLLNIDIGGVEAGSKAVCVKTCDGSFFPVSYTASSAKMGSLEELCRAQCPNADVALYSYPSSGDIEQAVSSTGERYIDSPNALKFRKSFDPTCSCRKRGQSWVDALAEAEMRMGEAKGDILVTPQKAEEMSRPIAPTPTPTPVAKGGKAGATPTPTPTPTGAGALKAAPGTDINGVDTALSAQAATVSRDTSGIAAGDAASGAHVGADQGQYREVAGPDGVKRRVRIIDPTL